MGNEDKRRQLPSDYISSHFAWIRTRLSIVRTLEAWVRTSISLIGFGFTIVQFFERLDQSHWTAPARFPNVARYMGLVLIGIGTVALAISIWQYESVVKYLHSEMFAEIAHVKDIPKIRTLLLVAVVLCAVGLATFIAVLFNVV